MEELRQTGSSSPLMNTIIRDQIAENGIIYEQHTNENSKNVTPKLSPMKTIYSDNLNSTGRSNQPLNVQGVA